MEDISAPTLDAASGLSMTAAPRGSEPHKARLARLGVSGTPSVAAQLACSCLTDRHFPARQASDRKPPEKPPPRREPGAHDGAKVHDRE